MRIRTKLTLWYSGLLAIIIVIFGAVVFRVMEFTLVDSVDVSLNQTAELVIRNSRVERFGMFGAPNQASIKLPTLDLFRASGVGVQVWEVTSEGGPVLEDSSNNLGDYADPLDSAALGLTEPSVKNVFINGNEFRVLTRPVFSVGKVFGSVQVIAPLDTLNQARDRLLLVLASAALLGVVGSVMLGMWLSRKALQPIESITRAAATIAQTEDLSTRLPWHGPQDELGRLTQVFNQMMGRLEDLFSLQRRFVADVSHELRTPLTAIRGNLDLIKRYGVDDLSLEAIESEAERMSRMVDDLLLLARADYGGLTLDKEPLDLDTVVMEAFQQGKVLIKDRELNLRMNAIEPVRISGHADRMKQVLLNLLSNAIKFTPDGGTITVSLTSAHTQAVISVTDTGIGISEEDCKHIFDRFYQADTSRMRTGESTGLGLAIVKWIVEAHDGTLSVESQMEKGSTFTVEIPLLTQHLHHSDDDNFDHHTGKSRTRPRLIKVRAPHWLTPES